MAKGLEATDTTFPFFQHFKTQSSPDLAEPRSGQWAAIAATRRTRRLRRWGGKKLRRQCLDGPAIYSILGKKLKKRRLEVPPS